MRAINTFLLIGSKEVGLTFLTSYFSSFLGIGAAFSFFHWSGNNPVCGQF